MKVLNAIKTVFKVLILASISWVLVHVFALFGVFLAISYPVWWFLTPGQAQCILCRSQKEGTHCVFCNRKIIKSEGASPVNLKSVLLNSGLIFTFSLIAIALIFVESQALSIMGIPPTSKTASFLIPSKGQYRLGEVFTMKLDISNIDNPINTVQADIGFNPLILEVVDINTVDSFAEIFIQKEINNEAGWARLSGGLPNPGFFGNRGTFGTVFFRGKTPGLVQIEFLPSSMVLANDGKGSNILKDLPSASYIILPERITEEELEQQRELFSYDSDILGASSEELGQLQFYEDSSVLGESVEKEIGKKPFEEFNLFDFLLGGLERINRFILDFWKRILGMAGS